MSLIQNGEKLYKVTFITYTNYSNDTVYNRELDIYTAAKEVVIKESEIEYWRNFGDGIESLMFVGYLVSKDQLVNTDD